MSKTANFKVDPKLAVLLGENYRSTELAIKELIDNAFDADAEGVNIRFPEPYTNDPIVITDNGTGMTEAEVRNEYLKVANSRFSRKGERTKGKNRLVKGRKGIGKFAGLMVAQEMQISTISRDIKTSLTISRDALSKANYDLEKINLPITVAPTKEPSGTSITLHGINDNLNFPNPERLKQILIVEYGREEDFSLVVNEEKISIEDIPGERFEHQLNLPNAGKVVFRYTISEKKLPKQSGIVLRVKGKIIGKPQFYGLEKLEQIPTKLQERLVGEIIADEIAEQDITADWGAIIENSKALEDIQKAIFPLLEKSFEDTYNEETKIAKSKLKKRVNAGLEKLPAFKQAFAKKALDKVMRKFFGDNESRIATVVGVMLDTFEKDDYWVVSENLEKSVGKDSATVSKALTDFGALDTALLVQQANHRLKLVKRLTELANTKKVSAEQMREAIATNLWLLSEAYASITANATLQTIMEEYLDRKFKDKKDRPSLILSSGYGGRYVLIECKSTDKELKEKDIAQVLSYREDLNIFFPKNKIEILVLSKKIEAKLDLSSMDKDIRLMTYAELTEKAEKQINWQLGSLA